MENCKCVDICVFAIIVKTVTNNLNIYFRFILHTCTSALCHNTAVQIISVCLSLLTMINWRASYLPTNSSIQCDSRVKLWPFEAPQYFVAMPNASELSTACKCLICNNFMSFTGISAGCRFECQQCFLQKETKIL